MRLNKLIALILLTSIVTIGVVQTLQAPLRVDPVLTETTLPLDMGAYEEFCQGLVRLERSRENVTLSVQHDRQEKPVWVRIRSPGLHIVAQKFGKLCFFARDHDESVAVV